MEAEVGITGAGAGAGGVQVQVRVQVRVQVQVQVRVRWVRDHAWRWVGHSHSRRCTQAVEGGAQRGADCHWWALFDDLLTVIGVSSRSHPGLSRPD